LNVNGHPVKVWISISSDDATVTFFDIPEFYSCDLNDAYIRCFNLGLDCRKALLEQLGIKTDEKVLGINFIPEIILCEYAEKLPDFLPLDFCEVRLNRNALDLQGKEIDQEARAWIDRSKGYWERESNDKSYSEDLLYEPIRVKEVHQDVKSTIIPKIDKIEGKVNKIEKDVEDLKNTSNGFLSKTEEVLGKFAEVHENFADYLQEYAEHSRTHLQYMKITSKTLAEHHDLLLKQQAQVNHLTDIALKAIETSRGHLNVTIMVNQSFMILIILMLLILGVAYLWLGKIMLQLLFTPTKGYWIP